MKWNLRDSVTFRNGFSQFAWNIPEGPSPYGSSSYPVVQISLTHFVHHDSSTQAQQSQFQSTNFQQPSNSLIQNSQILHFIFPSPEFLQDRYVFNGTINCEYWYGEFNFTCEKKSKLRENEGRRGRSGLKKGEEGRTVRLGKEVWTSGSIEKRSIGENVTKDSNSEWEYRRKNAFTT